MNSKEKLAQALEEVRKNWSDNPDNHSVENMIHLGNMIEKAREGYYSDYDSPLPDPCIKLVQHLEQIGAYDIKARAMNGEFDATIEESNAWYEREGRAMALEVTGGNEEIADALFGKVNEEEKEAKEGIKGWDI